MDRLSLLRLAWGRFDVYRQTGTVPDKAWSARLKILNGMSVHLRRNDVQHLAIFDELFLESAYDLTLIQFTPDLILDVGAHIGLFSLLAGSRWPDSPIIAFEPHPDNVTWVRRNTANNGVCAAVIEAATSTRCSWMKFNSGGGMGNLMDEGDLTVRVVDLPKVMAAIPSERTLLKMDIEGEEQNLLPLVLPILPATCAVFVEIHGQGEECDALLSQIHKLGFAHRTLREKRPEHSQWCFIDLLLTRH